MADDAGSSETQLTFHVKSSNEGKYTVTVPDTITVLELKQKLSTADYANIPPERQRLIYSGRVLKDPDTLVSVKIKDGNTVHLVKGAESNARQNPTNQSSSTASAGAGATPPAVPTNIAAGTGNNPLAALTGARYAGFHGLPGADAFGPDGGLGAPPDPDQILRMMENPNFLSQMNEAMNNPAFIEIMSQNPMLRDNPMARQMLQNPEFRRMMLNPDVLRMQLNMQRAMGGGGGSAFPAPGVTDTTPQDQQQGQTNNGSTTGGAQNQAQNPFAAGGFMPFPPNLGGGGNAANPFAALFAPQGQQQPGSQTGTTTSTSPPPASTDNGGQRAGSPTNNDSQQQPPNPFAGLFAPPPYGATGAAGQNQNNPLQAITQQLMQDPEAMRGMMQMASSMYGLDPNANPTNPPNPPAGGAAGAGANPFANLFDPAMLQMLGGMRGGGSPQPPDNRPPEERYAEQLRQLNDMGFYEFERNVQALRQSGGSVQGAVEFLLSG